jgi:hypothetical protein
MLICEGSFFLVVRGLLSEESFWNHNCSSIFLIGKTGKRFRGLLEGGWTSRGLVAKGLLGA